MKIIENQQERIEGQKIKTQSQKLTFCPGCLQSDFTATLITHLAECTCTRAAGNRSSDDLVLPRLPQARCVPSASRSTGGIATSACHGCEKRPKSASKRSYTLNKQALSAKKSMFPETNQTVQAIHQYSLMFLRPTPNDNA